MHWFEEARKTQNLFLKTNKQNKTRSIKLALNRKKLENNAKVWRDLSETALFQTVEYIIFYSFIFHFPKNTVSFLNSVYKMVESYKRAKM